MHCGNALNVGARFCRECGVAVAADPILEWRCPSCDTPNAAGARFCRECGRGRGVVAGEEGRDSAPTSAHLTPADTEARPAETPVALPAHVPVAAQDVGDGGSGTWRDGASWRPSRPLALALFALLVAGAAAGGYALSGGRGSRGDTAGLRDGAASQVAPAPNPYPSDEPQAANSTATATPEVAPATDPDVEARAKPRLNSPTGVIRAHWSAIDDGRYEHAFALFSSEYRARTSEGLWVAGHRADAPRVRIGLVRYRKALPDGQAWVFADVYTRDTGSRKDSSRCKRWAGTVRVVKQQGRWRYASGAAGDTWDRKAWLTRGDPGCRELFR